MRVVIDKATLKRHRACPDAYTSPEWSEQEQALVYEWPATIDRLLAKPAKANGTNSGLDQLEWLVRHKLVPMSAEEFEALKAAREEAPNG